jgi:hypothetical protein
VSRERISACLIVQDEQERIGAALESVAFCDETIVVDGGSTDRTVEIARAAGATVIENPWPGFASQRNVALDAAHCEWVLEIDADECVSPPLRASIEALLTDPEPSPGMAVCALRHRFLGRPLGSSAKYPAYRARIFRRDAYRHDESRAVHEGIEPRERPIVLDGDLEHELAETLGESLLDAWRYARLESRHLPRPRRPGAYLTGIVLRPAAKLAYRTLVERGLSDGWRGLLKISLDVASDALVWLLVLLRRGSAAGAKGEASDGSPPEHFGRRPNGPVKVVAIAGGAGATRTASRWLEGLRAHGLDVALIATGAGAPPGPRHGELSGAPSSLRESDVPLHSLQRLHPLAVIGALEVETQLRTTDAVVAVGRRARLLIHLLPKTLRPAIARLDVDLDPASAAELANAGVARH